MKTAQKKKWLGVESLLALAALLLLGCETSHSTTYRSEEVVETTEVWEDPGAVVLYDYALDVLVVDTWGQTCPAAAVEVHVTTYPQQSQRARTAFDGAARFAFRAQEGAAVVVYAQDPAAGQGLAETYTGSPGALLSVRLVVAD